MTIHTFAQKLRKTKAIVLSIDIKYALCLSAASLRKQCGIRRNAVFDIGFRSINDRLSFSCFQVRMYYPIGRNVSSFLTGISDTPQAESSWCKHQRKCKHFPIKCRRAFALFARTVVSRQSVIRTMQKKRTHKGCVRVSVTNDSAVNQVLVLI